MMLICIKQHLSNIWRSIYEKVKQHWGWVEKSVAYKKVYISLAPLMIPLEVGVKAYLTIFVPPWISSCFCVNDEKLRFSRPDSVGSEIFIWVLTSLMDFYKSVQLLFKRQHESDCQKKISFVQITHLKLTFFTLGDIQSYFFIWN